MRILAIDPGSVKCGIAIAEGDEILQLELLTKDEFFNDIFDLNKKWQPDLILLGDGTCSQYYKQQITDLLPDISLEMVDETSSSEEARRLYWKYNVPKGWRALIPLGLLFPPEPYDQYVALILLERYKKHKNALSALN